ncbi:unnamed protein product, partial [marine sediment metagenome]
MFWKIVSSNPDARRREPKPNISRSALRLKTSDGCQALKTTRELFGKG